MVNALAFGTLGGALGAGLTSDPDGGPLPFKGLALIFGVMGALGGWLGTGL
jgi:hypothetical protein